MANLTDLERALKRTFGGYRKAALPSCLAIIDTSPTETTGALLDALPTGAAVIFRGYDLEGRREMATGLVGLCRKRGIRLLVAGDPGVAMAVKADGVHLPEWMVRRAATPLHLKRRPGWLVTAAAHSLAALRRAEAIGVDAALVSTTFATVSHRDRPPLGPLRFSRLCRAGQIPVFALGGVTATTTRRLAGSGAVGIAGIGVFRGQQL